MAPNGHRRACLSNLKAPWFMAPLLWSHYPCTWIEICTRRGRWKVRGFFYRQSFLPLALFTLQAGRTPFFPNASIPVSLSRTFLHSTEYSIVRPSTFQRRSLNHRWAAAGLDLSLGPFVPSFLSDTSLPTLTENMPGIACCDPRRTPGSYASIKYQAQALGMHELWKAVARGH